MKNENAHEKRHLLLLYFCCLLNIHWYHYAHEDGYHLAAKERPQINGEDVSTSRSTAASGLTRPKTTKVAFQLNEAASKEDISAR